MNNFLVHFFQSYLLTREMKTTKKLFAGIEGLLFFFTKL